MPEKTSAVKALTRESLAKAVKQLSEQDPLLAELVATYGTPPLWQRTQSFATLVHIILEQKVSLASALAVMRRVNKLCPCMQPAAFLQIKQAPLKAAGISERKVSYCYSIAEAIVTGQLNLARLRRCDNESVMAQLSAIRGIGPWTAGVYLLMAMRRPDAWASGDRALVVSYAESLSMQQAAGQPPCEVPSYAVLDEVAERWQPYRAAAARILWHAYLSRRGKMQ